MCSETEYPKLTAFRVFHQSRIQTKGKGKVRPRTTNEGPEGE